MERNYNYKLIATPLNPDVKLTDFEEHFGDIKIAFNSHKVRHPKEIDSIEMSKDVNNAIAIDLWTEYKLTKGRELMGVRRVSELLAGYDSTIVVPKSHVLVSV